MTDTALENYALAYLDACTGIHQYHAHKSPMPVSRQAVSCLRKKLFANILKGEINEEYADAAQRVLSVLAKSLERKEVTAEGRASIEADSALEALLILQGFKFQPAYGDYIKTLGCRREYWLCVFLNEDGEATATLSHYQKILTHGGEFGRWSLLDLGGELANVLQKAEKIVVHLQGPKP